MSWVWAMLLTAASLGLVLLLLRRTGKPRVGWEAVGAALLLGIAGYGLQGSPDLPGAPKAPAQQIQGDPQALVAARQALDGKPVGEGSNWVVIADAFTRQGQYANAATILLGALEKDPQDAEAWLALANALVGHADETLSPAALYAYRHAALAAPDHPGPPYFLGLAMAQSGRLADARRLWTDLLERSPPDAPWRGEVEAKLAQLNALIARQLEPPVRSGAMP